MGVAPREGPREEPDDVCKHLSRKVLVYDNKNLGEISNHWLLFLNLSHFYFQLVQGRDLYDSSLGVAVFLSFLEK